MNNAKFLTRSLSGDLEITKGFYQGKVPLKVLERYARYVRRQDEKGVYYPADTMDVYSMGLSQLEHRAANLPADVRNPVAYLSASARVILLKIRQTVVMPQREEYRAIEGRIAADGGDSGADENAAPMLSTEMAKAFKCGNEQVTLSAYDLALSLAAAPDSRKAYFQAVECLRETMPKLKPETRRAFECWVLAKGVQYVAADMCGESRFKYARLWRERCREFRRACTWVSVEGL